MKELKITNTVLVKRVFKKLKLIFSTKIMQISKNKKTKSESEN